MLLNTVVMRIVGIPFAAAGSCSSLALVSQSFFLPLVAESRRGLTSGHGLQVSKQNSEAGALMMSWNTDAGSCTWVTPLIFWWESDLQFLQVVPKRLLFDQSKYVLQLLLQCQGRTVWSLSSRGKAWAWLLPSAVSINVTRFCRRKGVKVTKKYYMDLSGKMHSCILFFFFFLTHFPGNVLDPHPHHKEGSTSYPRLLA